MATKQAQLKEQAYASKLKSRALSVLIYLIDRSNQELTCFPAIPTMAEQLHISISTVKRALRELVDEGYIDKEVRFREKNRGQSSNLYTLTLKQERDGVENNNNPDAGKEPESVIDNSCSIKEGKKRNFSAIMPQGRKVEHVGFKSLKKKDEEPERKEKLGECRAEKEKIVPIGCLIEGFKIMRKQKKSPHIHRCLVDCTPVHFEIASFKACFRRLYILGKGKMDGEVSIDSPDYCLFLSWTGEGVSLKPP